MAKRKAQDSGAAGSFLIALLKQLETADEADLEEWYAFGEIATRAIEAVGGFDEGAELERAGDPEGVDNGQAPMGPDPSQSRDAIPFDGGRSVTRAQGDPAIRVGQLATAARLGGELASLPRDLLERVVRGVLGSSLAGLKGVKLPVEKPRLDEELIDG